MKIEKVFRAKPVEGNEWVYGGITSANHSPNNKVQIVSTEFFEGDEENEHYVFVDVIEDTVGQFIGITTKNEHPDFYDVDMLFEDDIYQIGNDTTKYKVTLIGCEWWGVSNEGDKWGVYKHRLSLSSKDKITILGNVFDNPELFPL